MSAEEIIAELREQNFTVRVDGDYIELSPPCKITEELIARVKKNKPAIIAELKREEQRTKVLTILAESPNTLRAIIADMDNDSNEVLLTIALSDKYIFEMTISKVKFDSFRLLEFLNKGGIK